MIIVGFGISAMISAYYALKNNSNVLVLTKSIYNQNYYNWQLQGGCSWKTHAFNMPVNKEDIAYFIEDTLIGSDYLADKNLVQTLCKNAYNNLKILKELELEVDKDKNGNPIHKPFGGNGKPRAVYIEDRLGFHIVKALNQAFKQYLESGHLQVIEGVRVISLDTDSKMHRLKFININTNEEFQLYTKTVVFADGGGASMYSPSAASKDKTCDGLKIALDNSLELIDMEFVQFHPTGIVSCNPVFNGGLFEESLRFAGATLHNKNNERFVFNYHQEGERATRDKVSRAMYNEIQLGKGVLGGIELDIKDCKPIIQSEYPALLERLYQAGYNIETENRILVKPVAHFMMGGVKINQRCETSIEGIYFVGESAGGLHGANRLGGNGLTEAIVFGQIAGYEASKYDDSSKMEQIEVLKSITHLKKNFKYDGHNNFLYDMQKLKCNMYKYAGPIRDLTSLNIMLDEIKIKQAKHYNFLNTPLSNGYQLYLDYVNMLDISEVIVKVAMARKESRGSHYRTDYTEPSLQNINYICKKENNNIHITSIKNI